MYHNLGEKANKALDDLEDNYRIKLLGLIRVLFLTKFLRDKSRVFILFLNYILYF